MGALNINRLSKRYHLQPSQRERQRLLDASLQQVFEEDLDVALAELGIEEYGEICVRLVHVSLSFSLGHSQSDTCRHWSRIIARQICTELEKNSDNVLRFRSRLQALIAFADDISHNSMQRSWAWNQIGLSNLSTDASLNQARSQLVTALMREPTAILTVFKRLAEKQRLLPWLVELSSEEQTVLVDGLLSAADIEPRWLTSKTEAILVDAAEINQSPTLGDVSLSGSSLLKHLSANTSDVAKLSTEAHTWVILVLLEIEPMLFNRPAQVIKQSIAAAKQQLLSVFGVRGQAVQQKIERVDKQVTDTVRTSITSDTDKETSQDIAKDPVEATPADNTKVDAENRLQQEQSQIRQQSDQDEVSDPPVTAEQLQEATAIPEFIHSEFAGLFLLLAVLGETVEEGENNLIKQITAEPDLSARPLNWVLYQLTTRWLAIPTEDPALREFCAIDIDADWPFASDEEVTDLEASALDKYQCEIENHLFARYSPEGIDQAAIIATLCRQRAQLLIDSGWLELVFELNDVDTDIRRGGLDLDPGFVPWLGKVVKIRYE
ncbi:MAG: hypothetical protein GY784_11230 [Gammaproteobacteria bacterium]|nr:hypothetical protein [Gammaproteobacteria bacterium]